MVVSSPMLQNPHQLILLQFLSLHEGSYYLHAIMCNPHAASTDSLCNNNIKIQKNILLANSCATPHQNQTGLTSSLQLKQQHISSLHLHLHETIWRTDTKSQGNQQWEPAQVSLQ
jgi:hypothetical protein